MTDVEKYRRKCNGLLNKLHKLGKSIDAVAYKSKYNYCWPKGWIRDMYSKLKWAGAVSISTSATDEFKINYMMNTIETVETVMKENGVMK